MTRLRECDCCGRTQASFYVDGNWPGGWYAFQENAETADSLFGGERTSWDLCGACARETTTFLRERATEHAATAASQEQVGDRGVGA